MVALAWALIGTVAAANYYMSYNASLLKVGELEGKLNELRGNLTGVEARYAELRRNVGLVTVYIDYGNGTVTRYENVAMSTVHPTAFLALISVADAEFQTSSFGVFVTSINGVKQSVEESKFWLYYAYEEGKGWTSPPVAADKYPLADGASISWNFTKITF